MSSLVDMGVERGLGASYSKGTRAGARRRGSATTSVVMMELGPAGGVTYGLGVGAVAVVVARAAAAVVVAGAVAAVVVLALSLLRYPMSSSRVLANDGKGSSARA